MSLKSTPLSSDFFISDKICKLYPRQEALSSAVSEKDAHLQWLEVTSCSCFFSMPMIVQIHACQILGGWRGDQQRSHPGNSRETSSREERPAQQDEGGGEEEEDSSSHLSACHFFHFPPSFLVLPSWTETRFFNHATSSIKGKIPNLRN